MLTLLAEKLSRFDLVLDDRLLSRKDARAKGPLLEILGALGALENTELFVLARLVFSSRMLVK